MLRAFLLGAFALMLLAPAEAAEKSNDACAQTSLGATWCTNGLGGAFTAAVRQGETADKPLPVDYRLCRGQLAGGAPSPNPAIIRYGLSNQPSSPLPISTQIQPDECVCVTDTAGLQVASVDQWPVSGTYEILPRGSFAKSGACKRSDPLGTPVNKVSLSRPRLVAAKCHEFYPGTPYHQVQCEVINRARAGAYRLCFPSNYIIGRDSFAGGYVRLFVNARFMETNEGEYDARRSDVTTTCMDVYDARSIQLNFYEPQPSGPALPPLHGVDGSFSNYWTVAGIKGVRATVSRITVTPAK